MVGSAVLGEGEPIVKTARRICEGRDGSNMEGKEGTSSQQWD